ncbi:phage terminase large subunit [Arachidicoccus rhizosphaerae]|uniref:Phage terminase large subunit n=1 Tax=Arachidicoccus rhizosphaerae TaxID=551991 RepID=A0A1H4CEW2_9BACT|nr:terminase large subunit [Arachidicoccus rhizosphaerae]SEA58888.1 phage terminase large subunit [Arachidicoccus rhizosphaerae]
MTVIARTIPPKLTKVNGFTYTTAIRKLRRLKRRIKCVPGGSSAGKTFGILPILIDKAARTPKLEISVVSESIPHLRRGALKDFIKIMQATGRFIDANWNRTLLKYTFGNGSYIEFFSVENEQNVRGPRRKILYVNEANNISFDTYHQLAIRTSDEIWLDWNPSNEFWAYTELLNDPDADWLTLTYQDNEALPDAIVKELEKGYNRAFKDPELAKRDWEAGIKPDNIKSSYWLNWVKVYLRGELGSLEGVIFSNWEIIDELPAEAKYLGTGLDFGYTNDPTAAPDVYKWNDYRIIDEAVYQTGLMNHQIAEKIKGKGPVYADSAEPKSIDEIALFGIPIFPTVKGKDSINYGIQLMQQQKYLVTRRSVNAIKELRNYCWDTDKTGKSLNKPIDAFNHIIDGLRYHEMMTLSQPEPWDLSDLYAF